MVSKNSNIMTRKKCATCENHEVKADLEPCKSCIKLKDGTKFMNYKQSLEKEITWKSIEMGYITDEELDAEFKMEFVPADRSKTGKVLNYWIVERENPWFQFLQ